MQSTSVKPGTYFAIPMVLFQDDALRQLSLGAKVLYGILLNRHGLSVQNGWKDESGQVFLYYTLEEMRQTLGCCRQKAQAYLQELVAAGLVSRRRQGSGKPSRIYVHPLPDAPSLPSRARGDSAAVTGMRYSRHRPSDRHQTEFCPASPNYKIDNDTSRMKEIIKRMMERDDLYGPLEDEDPPAAGEPAAGLEPSGTTPQARGKIGP